MEFNANWERAVLRANKNADNIIKESAYELFRDIILDTPVDTGALLGNWAATIGGAYSSFTGILDKGGSQTVTSMKSVVESYKPGIPLYLTNTKPYAERIEYGYSSQAPIGMVRVNVLRFGDIIARVSREWVGKV